MKTIKLLIIVMILFLISCKGDIVVYRDGFYHVDASLEKNGVFIIVKRGFPGSYIYTGFCHKPSYSDSLLLEFARKEGIYIIERDKKFRKQYKKK